MKCGNVRCCAQVRRMRPCASAADACFKASGEGEGIMLITTKGRYAMRLIIRIAQQGPGGKIPLRKVAEEEDISLKYLEQVVRPLMAAGLVRSVRGKGGGYALARDAADIRAGDVLRAAEGSTVPVVCLALEDGSDGCPRKDACTTVRFWAGLDEVIEQYVDSATIADFVEHAPAAATAVEGC